jgi:hypothetical protein
VQVTAVIRRAIRDPVLAAALRAPFLDSGRSLSSGSRKARPGGRNDDLAAGPMLSAKRTHEFRKGFQNVAKPLNGLTKKKLSPLSQAALESEPSPVQGAGVASPIGCVGGGAVPAAREEDIGLPAPGEPCPTLEHYDSSA